ncbi:MAG: Lrp/AsnC family transcriptional regulator [Candidatus Micrarchaeia archaeon]
MSEELLEVLEKNARATLTDLAAMLGKSESKVQEEIKALQDSGTIKQFKTVVDWEKVGRERVYSIIEVKLSPERGRGYDAVAERIMLFPEVRTGYLLSGSYDLIVIVEGKSLKDVSNFVAEKLAPIEGVTSTNTHFLLKKYKEDGQVFFEKEDADRLAVTA